MIKKSIIYIYHYLCVICLMVISTCIVTIIWPIVKISLPLEKLWDYHWKWVNDHPLSKVNK